MCGLVGFVLAYRPGLKVLDAELFEELNSLTPADALERFESIARELVHWRGVKTLFHAPRRRAMVKRWAEALRAHAKSLEAQLESLTSTNDIEELSNAAIRARDIAWRLDKDALGNIERLKELGCDAGSSEKTLFEKYRLVVVLNNLARLEVRGRDSAGIGIAVTMTEDELDGWLKTVKTLPETQNQWLQRSALPAFRSGSIVLTQARAADQTQRFTLCFAHKVAKEIGELGDNIKALQRSLKQDRLLNWAMGRENAQVALLAHNRWASNGVINELNCHPLTQELSLTEPMQCPPDGDRFDAPLWPRLVLGALNGDIDNEHALKTKITESLWGQISPGITTDAKVIPVAIDQHLHAGAQSLSEAAAKACQSFEGSFAIGLLSSFEPNKLVLAQHGSGQALYVGQTADGGFLFASELYGIVELCQQYFKLDGVGTDGRSAGEIVVLNEQDQDIECVMGFDGQLRESWQERMKSVAITTRDINRASFEHYLLKEINESTRSVKKTLRGRLSLNADQSQAQLFLPEDSLPQALRRRLRESQVQEIMVIGQGTAAIAASAIADLMREYLGRKGLLVSAMKATELSGFHLNRLDSSVLIVAVSQSGTTTDTNRTVDLARERGCAVLSIVNRRGSDLTDKSDGVIYTSDGRDIEMSVASTKAFYCQVVAGYLLGLDCARELQAIDTDELNGVLRELADLPRRMKEVLGQRETIRRIARDHANKRRYWSVVGSGPGRIAAEEIRIKLSELCYKSMSADTIEDKKHIDLSAEALIFVCAAGLSDSTAQDAVKEISIFKAHSAIPIVVCDRGETRFSKFASAVIEVPASSPRVALLLNTLAGHLFSYYAALSIDSRTKALKQARELFELALAEAAEAANKPGQIQGIAQRFRERLQPIAHEIFCLFADGEFNSGLPSNLSFQVGEALRMGLGHLPLEAVQAYVQPPTRSNQWQAAMATLSAAIDQLKRPIDAIKHQAKTVTVGISRGETQVTLDSKLAQTLGQAGVSSDQLELSTSATLAAFDPFVEDILGATIYEVTGLSLLGLPTAGSQIQTLNKVGCAKDMSSRADQGTVLSGTKRKVVSAPRVYIGAGASDGRTILILPLNDNGSLTGLALIHVKLREQVVNDDRVQALKLAGRYEDVRALVTEHHPVWEDSWLDEISVNDLLTLDQFHLADRIRQLKSG